MNSKHQHHVDNHRRRMATLFLLGSFFATPFAQAGIQRALRRNFGRIVPHNVLQFTSRLLYHTGFSYNDHPTDITTQEDDYCLETIPIRVAIQEIVENSLAGSLYFRAGYQDDSIAVATDEATATNTDRVQQHPRLDTKAKSKQYGSLEFGFFQEGDGSAEDLEGIPYRYLRMQLHKRDLARQAVLETLEWREQNNIDTILKRPHPDFDVCKAVFPHYFATRDMDGHVVFVQRPALLNLELATKNGLDSEHLLNHYVYVNEYLWQIVEGDSPLATMTSIIDLQGLKISVMRQSDVTSFIKIFVTTMDKHYPQRAHKTLVINVPRWFNVLYKLVSPLLRESTKSRIEIYGSGKRQDKALYACLGQQAESILPASFFGKNKKKASQYTAENSIGNENDEDEDDIPTPDEHIASDLERELREFTLARIMEAGISMQQVTPLQN